MEYQKQGIRIGDVGTITANGAFDFLFNACEHNDPPGVAVNPTKLPDGFELLKPVIRTGDTFGPRAHLTSNNVKESCAYGL